MNLNSNNNTNNKENNNQAKEVLTKREQRRRRRRYKQTNIAQIQDLENPDPSGAPEFINYEIRLDEQHNDLIVIPKLQYSPGTFDLENATFEGSATSLDPKNLCTKTPNRKTVHKKMELISPENHEYRRKTRHSTMSEQKKAPGRAVKLFDLRTQSSKFKLIPEKFQSAKKEEGSKGIAGRILGSGGGYGSLASLKGYAQKKRQTDRKVFELNKKIDEILNKTQTRFMKAEEAIQSTTRFIQSNNMGLGETGKGEEDVGGGEIEGIEGGGGEGLVGLELSEPETVVVQITRFQEEFEEMTERKRKMKLEKKEERENEKREKDDKYDGLKDQEVGNQEIFPSQTQETPSESFTPNEQPTQQTDLNELMVDAGALTDPQNIMPSSLLNSESNSNLQTPQTDQNQKIQQNRPQTNQTHQEKTFQMYNDTTDRPTNSKPFVDIQVDGEYVRISESSREPSTLLGFSSMENSTGIQDLQMNQVDLNAPEKRPIDYKYDKYGLNSGVLLVDDQEAQESLNKKFEEKFEKFFKKSNEKNKTLKFTSNEENELSDPQEEQGEAQKVPTTSNFNQIPDQRELVAQGPPKASQLLSTANKARLDPTGAPRTEIETSEVIAEIDLQKLAAEEEEASRDYSKKIYFPMSKPLPPLESRIEEVNEESYSVVTTAQQQIYSNKENSLRIEEGSLPIFRVEEELGVQDPADLVQKSDRVLRSQQPELRTLQGGDQRAGSGFISVDLPRLTFGMPSEDRREKSHEGKDWVDQGEKIDDKEAQKRNKEVVEVENETPYPSNSISNDIIPEEEQEDTISFASKKRTKPSNQIPEEEEKSTLIEKEQPEPAKKNLNLTKKTRLKKTPIIQEERSFTVDRTKSEPIFLSATLKPDQETPLSFGADERSKSLLTQQNDPKNPKIGQKDSNSNSNHLEASQQSPQKQLATSRPAPQERRKKMLRRALSEADVNHKSQLTNNRYEKSKSRLKIDLQNPAKTILQCILIKNEQEISKDKNNSDRSSTVRKIQLSFPDCKTSSIALNNEIELPKNVQDLIQVPVSSIRSDASFSRSRLSEMRRRNTGGHRSSFGGDSSRFNMTVSSSNDRMILKDLEDFPERNSSEGNQLSSILLFKNSNFSNFLKKFLLIFLESKHSDEEEDRLHQIPLHEDSRHSSDYTQRDSRASAEGGNREGEQRREGASDSPGMILQGEDVHSRDKTITGKVEPSLFERAIAMLSDKRTVVPKMVLIITILLIFELIKFIVNSQPESGVENAIGSQNLQGGGMGALNN